MLVGNSVLAFHLFVRLHGSSCDYGGVWRPECRGPVLRGWQVVLDHVVVVVRVCWSRLAPWEWWLRWQGLVVVVGVSVVHVVLWCGPMCRQGRVPCGPRLCWRVVMI